MCEMLTMLKKTAASALPRYNNSWFPGLQSNSGPPSPVICHNCKGIGHGYQEYTSQRDAISSKTPSRPNTLFPKSLNGPGLN